jgi:hypothetical protein
MSIKAASKSDSPLGHPKGGGSCVAAYQLAYRDSQIPDFPNFVHSAHRLHCHYREFLSRPRSLVRAKPSIQHILIPSDFIIPF